MRNKYERESDDMASVLNFIFNEYFSENLEPRIKFKRSELTALSGKAELKAEDFRDIDKSLREYGLILLKASASDCWVVTEKWYTRGAPSVPSAMLAHFSPSQKDIYFKHDPLNLGTI